MYDFLSLLTFQDISSFIQQYQYFVAVLTPLVFGEVAIYLFGVFIGAGDASPLAVFVAFVSIIFYEALVLIGVQFLRRHDMFPKSWVQKTASFPLIAKLERAFTAYEEKYRAFPLFLLFALKTMPFTKVTIFFFTIRYPMPLLQFIIKDCIVTVIWASFIFVPGLLVGKGILTETEGQSIGTFFLFLVLFLIITMILGKYIERFVHRIMEKIMQLKNRNKQPREKENSIKENN